MDYLRSGVQDQPGQHGETLSLLKIQKISRAWWHVPEIPATGEAEAGESVEPGRRHSSLSNGDSISKKKRTREARENKLKT